MFEFPVNKLICEWFDKCKSHPQLQCGQCVVDCQCFCYFLCSFISNFIVLRMFEFDYLIRVSMRKCKYQSSHPQIQFGQCVIDCQLCCDLFWIFITNSISLWILRFHQTSFHVCEFFKCAQTHRQIQRGQCGVCKFFYQYLRQLREAEMSETGKWRTVLVDWGILPWVELHLQKKIVLSICVRVNRTQQLA